MGGAAQSKSAVGRVRGCAPPAALVGEHRLIILPPSGQFSHLLWRLPVDGPIPVGLGHTAGAQRTQGSGFGVAGRTRCCHTYGLSSWVSLSLSWLRKQQQ